MLCITWAPLEGARARLSASPWNPWAWMWAWTHSGWGSEHRWPSRLAGDGCEAARFPSPGGSLLKACCHHEHSVTLNCCLVHPQAGGVCALIMDFLKFFIYLFGLIHHHWYLLSSALPLVLVFWNCCFPGQSLHVCIENNSEVYFIRLIWIGVLVLKLTIHTHTLCI